MFNAIPLNGQTWLICGGRDFADQEMFDGAMSQLIDLRGMPGRIVHGAASGADTLASKWGHRHALQVVAMRADWEKHGKAAGPIRNQEMLDLHRPDFVIAFPGGRGTADMVARARKASVEVAEIRALCR
jgi:hypothetical protein